MRNKNNQKNILGIRQNNKSGDIKGNESKKRRYPMHKRKTVNIPRIRTWNGDQKRSRETPRRHAKKVAGR